jgi:hypothetical protein
MQKGRWAPTLIGGLELESDLARARDYARGNRPAPAAHLELAEIRTLRKLLGRYPIVAWRDDVFCRPERIGRTLAEKMIASFLDSNLNGSELQRLKPYRFVWVRSNTVVTPVTLGPRKRKAAK